MATVDEALQTQIRNIEATYGRSMAEWRTIVEASGKAKHGEIVAFLKADHGMSHGNANRVALVTRESDAASLVRNASAAGIDPIDALYVGPKAALKPIHDRLMAVIQALGDDIEIAPKSSYLSVRRAKQFALIQPSTATRLDLGLILKDMPTTKRLEVGKSLNAMFTHRVRLTEVAGVDAEVTEWLREAYSRAG